ncbi:10034_t:CDS:1, partial [Racocetra fulgida]
NELVYDFINQNTNLFVEQDFTNFLDINNKYIPINIKLNNKQIIEIILAKQNRQEQDNYNNTNKELVQISILE